MWYDEPAGAEWLRALPVGNGRFGAMVFGNTDTERLQLNEDTLWAGELRLALGAVGGVSGYERWLDLTTATTVVTNVANSVRHRREVIASAPDQVIAMRLTPATSTTAP